MVNNIKGLQLVNFIQGRKGIYQVIVKTQAGFLTAYEVGSEMPSLNRWKKGALQTIQFQEQGAYGWLTVFARKGNKVVIMDEEIAQQLEVATVNQLFYNTNLMDQVQYRAVGARTWADKVFVENKITA
jgi:hypothetical protein